MTKLIETKVVNGKTEHTFSVDVVVSKEKKFTDEELTARKAKLEAKKLSLTESLAEVDSDLEEITALIDLI